MRALIVDDSYDSRVLAEYILNELGCDVQSVVSGTASLQAVKENDFDLIVMDWNMPGLNGRETIIELDKYLFFKRVSTKSRIIIYTHFPLVYLNLPKSRHLSICTYISKEHTPHRQLQQFKKIIQNLSYKEAS